MTQDVINEEDGAKLSNALLLVMSPTHIRLCDELGKTTGPLCGHKIKKNEVKTHRCRLGTGYCS